MAYYIKSKVLYGYDTTLFEPGRQTIAHVLKEKGYKTAMVGKWHMGLNYSVKNVSKPQVSKKGTSTPKKDDINIDFSKPVLKGPNQLGYDYSYILPASLDMSPYIYIENGNVLGNKIVYKTNLPNRNGYIEENFNRVEVLDSFTVNAKEWIVDHVAKQPEQPFLMVVTPSSPHTPHVPAKRLKIAPWLVWEPMVILSFRQIGYWVN